MTPQLDIMADNLRRRADQLVGDPADLHRIIRHQPVASHDQLDGGLTLANAGVTSDHDTLAGDVQQHTVAGDAGGQNPVQILNGTAGKLHGGLLRPQQRPAVFPGTFQALREAVQSPRNHQCRDVVKEQIVKALTAPLLGQPL